MGVDGSMARCTVIGHVRAREANVRVHGLQVTTSLRVLFTVSCELAVVAIFLGHIKLAALAKPLSSPDTCPLPTPSKGAIVTSRQRRPLCIHTLDVPSSAQRPASPALGVARQRSPQQTNAPCNHERRNAALGAGTSSDLERAGTSGRVALAGATSNVGPTHPHGPPLRVEGHHVLLVLPPPACGCPNRRLEAPFWALRAAERAPERPPERPRAGRPARPPSRAREGPFGGRAPQWLAPLTRAAARQEGAATRPGCRGGGGGGGGLGGGGGFMAAVVVVVVVGLEGDDVGRGRASA
eukprot:scaffold582_cov385-Prasinococcus_capsulatus_cf.AAC.7